MNTRMTTFVLGLVLALGCVWAGVVTIRHHLGRQAPQPTAKADPDSNREADRDPGFRDAIPTAPPPAPQRITPEPVAPPLPTTPQPRLVNAERPVSRDGGTVVVPPRPRQTPRRADAGPQDPLARCALSYVGADPEAEQVWGQAINDPSLSAHERKDLIEDLNEDGFPDPKNLTLDDLPLIVRRIELIEQLAPHAMDDVNAAAFQEAYKDLVNMYARLVLP